MKTCKSCGQVYRQREHDLPEMCSHCRLRENASKAHHEKTQGLVKKAAYAEARLGRPGSRA